MWINRFRYTNVQLLAMRFGVAAQNVRVRLKRLEAGGMVRLERRSVVEPWIVSLTPAGAKAVEHRPRRAPRAELHQAHERRSGGCARMSRRTRATSAPVCSPNERRGRSTARR